MQRIELKGNLGKDVELKYTASNKKVVDTTLAVNEKSNDKELTTWFNIRAWEYNAMNMSGLKKGDSVFIIGRMRNDRYTAKDGTEKTYNYVLVDYLVVEQKKAKNDLNKLGIDTSDLPFYE